MENKHRKSKKLNKSSKLDKAGNIFFAILFIAGVLLLTYPAISNLVNQHSQSHAIENYDMVSNDLSSEEKEMELEKARKFNANLYASGSTNGYENTLNISNGIMCHIKIPKIDMELPVYHGTSEGVLRQGAGHIENTSLPVGGKSTHCTISGHTGLPSTKMFTNITKLEEGDIFIIKVLGKTLTYEVEDINTVLPEDSSKLAIQNGRDLCTLVTCTPYGVNSHRLLVTGHRTKNRFPEPNISNIDFVSIAMLMTAAGLVVVYVRSKRKSKSNLRKKKEGI